MTQNTKNGEQVRIPYIDSTQEIPVTINPGETVTLGPVHSIISRVNTITIPVYIDYTDINTTEPFEATDTEDILDVNLADIARSREFNSEQLEERLFELLLEKERLTYNLLKKRFFADTYNLRQQANLPSWYKVIFRFLEKPWALIALTAIRELQEHDYLLTLTGVRDGRLIFDELIKEIPQNSQRRNKTYEDSISMLPPRVKFTEPSNYQRLGDEYNIEMDQDSSWSWLYTRPEVLEAGFALDGRQGKNKVVGIYRNNSKHSLHGRAFRCSLEV